MKLLKDVHFRMFGTKLYVFQVSFEHWLTSDGRQTHTDDHRIIVGHMCYCASVHVGLRFLNACAV